jgi:hypothetical protein
VTVQFTEADKKVAELERKLRVSQQDMFYIFQWISQNITHWKNIKIDSLDAAVVSNYAVWNSVSIDILSNISTKDPTLRSAAKIAQNILKGETLGRIISEYSLGSEMYVFYGDLFKIMQHTNNYQFKNGAVETEIDNMVKSIDVHIGSDTISNAANFLSGQYKQQSSLEIGSFVYIIIN